MAWSITRLFCSPGGSKMDSMFDQGFFQDSFLSFQGKVTEIILFLLAIDRGTAIRRRTGLSCPGSSSLIVI